MQPAIITCQPILIGFEDLDGFLASDFVYDRVFMGAMIDRIPGIAGEIVTRYVTVQGVVEAGWIAYFRLKLPPMSTRGPIGFNLEDEWDRVAGSVVRIFTEEIELAGKTLGRGLLAMPGGYGYIYGCFAGAGFDTETRLYRRV